MEPQEPTPNPPPELTWSRACLLALGWTVGGIVATAIAAGLLNSLSLVDGQDMIVTFWTGIVVAVGVMAGSPLVHRSWRVSVVLPLLLVPAGLLVGFVAIVVTYGQWAK